MTEPGEALAGLASMFFGVNQDSVYLSPGPIYHAAPLRWCGSIQVLGGTVVMTKRFDAEQVLAAIQDHHVTHAQFVPTMFVRMLQLPQDTRDRYDVSSLRVAIHAAAPCPVEVKQKMIDWWGPVLFEYYAGTEGNGMTAIDSATWLTKPGTVGRPIMGTVRICADDGTELPAGQTGGVYFESEEIPFAYHNDPDKTRAAQHRDHPNWTTLGDIGYLDEDGFLFLTDRKAFTIISGGVNIYPQETENVLALHPAVYDVAVIGLPDPEMGESVAAFVQPAPGAVPGPELEQEIIAFVKSKIAGFKAPRTVRFVDSLPRSEAGKLMKIGAQGQVRRRLKDRGEGQDHDHTQGSDRRAGADAGGHVRREPAGRPGRGTRRHRDQGGARADRDRPGNRRRRLLSPSPTSTARRPASGGGRRCTRACRSACPGCRSTGAAAAGCRRSSPRR